MIFTSIEFVIFSIIFFPLYFLFKGHWRVALCVLASYVFYGWWDWRFLALILFSTTVDYTIGRQLANAPHARRKILLLASVVVNLGLLGFFKYFNFFTESFADAAHLIGLNPSPIILNIVLPVGISFYTFQTMSYTIDVYRGRCAVEHNFMRFAAYVALFPQLVAGPIVRARTLLPQLQRDQPFDWSRLAVGLEWIIWGLFLKLCVADRLATIVDPPFNNPDAFGGGVHLFASVGFAFQIYGDFCGYSLIAIGLGKIMGFDFGQNFKRPYLARNFSDFWERWHISLSSWLREYLYIPLGGNRLGAHRTLRNLIIVMFLGGLWHGAAWAFVVWGLLHAGYLILQRVVEKPFGNLRRLFGRYGNFLVIVQILSVFILTDIAWVFFRAESFGDAMKILGKILTGTGYLNGASYNLFGLVVGVAMIGFVVLVDICTESRKISELYLRLPALRMGCAVFLVWMISFLGVFNGTTFIYFQF
jgi:alginate O-acetyltransferase complex protein AlgI